MSTRIISTSEFRENQKKYLDLAEKERVVIKRGRNLITLTVAQKVTDVNKTWFEEFFSIPEKFRCNPFDYSPSGDLFYADTRNVEHVKSAIEKANQGAGVRIGTKEELKSFLDKL
ncbi:MAG: hypothetical protein LBL04_03020 [Bacteroidales bacterium]|nr:hypothetical protein [Bacteroidales bacterium]